MHLNKIFQLFSYLIDLFLPCLRTTKKFTLPAEILPEIIFQIAKKIISSETILSNFIKLIKTMEHHLEKPYKCIANVCDRNQVCTFKICFSSLIHNAI